MKKTDTALNVTEYVNSFLSFELFSEGKRIVYLRGRAEKGTVWLRKDWFAFDELCLSARRMENVCFSGGMMSFDMHFPVFGKDCVKKIAVRGYGVPSESGYYADEDILAKLPFLAAMGHLPASESFSVNGKEFVTADLFALGTADRKYFIKLKKARQAALFEQRFIHGMLRRHIFADTVTLYRGAGSWGLWSVDNACPLSFLPLRADAHTP